MPNPATVARPKAQAQTKTKTRTKARAGSKARAAPAPVPARRRPWSEVLKTVAAATELRKEQVNAVVGALRDLAAIDLRPGGEGAPGVFKIPGLCTLRRARRAAQPERAGRNPATGEPMTIKARPAGWAVRAKADGGLLREGD